MGKRKTHKEYVEQVAEIYPNIEVIGKYINNRTKIMHRCKIDNTYWETKPNVILSGSGCPTCGKIICSNKRKKSHDQYVSEVAKINKDIEVVEQYIDDSTAILHKCKIDNAEWKAKPNNILHNHGCPECGKKKRSEAQVKSHNEYVQELYHVNPNIEIAEKYINSATKTLHRCKIDGTVWKALPRDVLRGHGCPTCNESSGEREISLYLLRNEILFEPQYKFTNCKNKKMLPFDFYLPEYNTCIEYDGIQHFEPVEIFGGEKYLLKQRENDNIKNEFCKNNNITLLRIKYNLNIVEELNNFFVNNTKLLEAN